MGKLVQVISLTSALLMACFISQSVAADNPQIGFPLCEQIIGADRYIVIGHPVLYTVKYLEDNKYACSKYLGNANEIISCRYKSNPKLEILLTVVDGKVTDIEAPNFDKDCTFNNNLPPPPKESGTPDD